MPGEPDGHAVLLVAMRNCQAGGTLQYMIHAAAHCKPGTAGVVTEDGAQSLSLDPGRNQHLPDMPHRKPWVMRVDGQSLMLLQLGGNRNFYRIVKRFKIILHDSQMPMGKGYEPCGFEQHAVACRCAPLDPPLFDSLPHLEHAMIG